MTTPRARQSACGRRQTTLQEAIWIGAGKFSAGGLRKSSICREMSVSTHTTPAD
ncbi:MAG: hypothetical protein WB510_14075 [Candidatus Sulfotelmatobacter sp.]